jgi:TRAP-type C4-dicarboxylate transport system permease large subunit
MNPFMLLILMNTYFLSIGIAVDSHPAMVISILGCLCSIGAYGLVPREDE